MRKLICLLLVVALCAGLVCSVSAETGFVPSITYKEEPEIVPVAPPADEDEEWEPIVGTVYEMETHQETSNIPAGCLVVIPVAEVADATEEDHLSHLEQELKDVYDALMDGSMEIPYELNENYNGQSMVVRELFGTDWMCGTPTYDHDHPTEVAPKGVVFDLTLRMDISPDTEILVMVYVDGEWEPAVEVINNGDGTVTCTFERLGIVSVSVPQDVPAPEAPAENEGNCWLWIILLILAAICFIVVIIIYRRKTSEEEETNE